MVFRCRPFLGPVFSFLVQKKSRLFGFGVMRLIHLNRLHVFSECVTVVTDHKTDTKRTLTWVSGTSRSGFEA